MANQRPISALQVEAAHSLDEKAKTMISRGRTERITTSIALVLFACCCVSTMTGCQVSLNGQTLPSPYYLEDDVQYFPSGPEFKLPREAAALKAARAEEKASRR